MGLLTQGVPLAWEDSLKFLDYVKKHGVEQFLNVLAAHSHRNCDGFKWGDEIEYLLVYAPRSDKAVVRLLCRSKEIQDSVKADSKQLAFSGQLLDCDRVIIHPEYGSFQIESTPFQPYLDTSEGLFCVERNMLLRRKMLERSLKADEMVMAIGSFPTLGCGMHLFPHCGTRGPYAMSDGFSDAGINPHPRFRTLTQNIRHRRGQKVDIRIPKFKDVNTDLKKKSSTGGGSDGSDIVMDAMGYGMGMCCLQVTFQCVNMSEARHLYDQLAVLAPIMAALTAATPFYHGFVSDNDVRWTVIAQSVDDRTKGERGEAPLKAGEKRIAKSRYDTVSCYLSLCDWHKDEYNDVSVETDEYSLERLVQAGVDPILARHVAHLFVRDPLAIYEDIMQLDDTRSTHHFETIQSTNWQSVRFKPPPSMDSAIGWRVEFRTMELSLTEFENAAYSIVSTLISRAILFFQLNFYIPISKVDENMRRAHGNNAAHAQKYFWRTCSSRTGALLLEEMSIEDILVGCDTCDCPGLLQIVDRYLDVIRVNGATRESVNEYISFVRKKATGELQTTAQWLRDFVYRSDLYKRDSVISEALSRQIIDVCDAVTHGRVQAPKLLGDLDIRLRTERILASSRSHTHARFSNGRLISRL